MERRTSFEADLAGATIASVSPLQIREVDEIGAEARFPVVPRQMALLNVDMQNCFVEGSPVSAPAGLVVLKQVNRLAAACRSAGIPIIHTAHVLRADGSNAGVMAEFIPAIRAGMI